MAAWDGRARGKRESGGRGGESGGTSRRGICHLRTWLRDGTETGGCSVLDVAQGMELRAVQEFGSHAGPLGTGDGVQSNTE